MAKPRTLQEKVLARIDEIIERAGWEPVHISQWANTGRILAQAKDSMVTKLWVTYMFDGSQVSLTVQDERVRTNVIPPDLPRERWLYAQPEEAAKFGAFYLLLDKLLKSGAD